MDTSKWDIEAHKQSAHNFRMFLKILVHCGEATCASSAVVVNRHSTTHCFNVSTKLSSILSKIQNSEADSGCQFDDCLIQGNLAFVNLKFVIWGLFCLVLSFCMSTLQNEAALEKGGVQYCLLDTLNCKHKSKSFLKKQGLFLFKLPTIISYPIFFNSHALVRGWIIFRRCFWYRSSPNVVVKVM